LREVPCSESPVLALGNAAAKLLRELLPCVPIGAREFRAEPLRGSVGFRNLADRRFRSPDRLTSDPGRRLPVRESKALKYGEVILARH
jgi:hypothetical protein